MSILFTLISIFKNNSKNKNQNTETNNIYIIINNF